jgi:opacity protein-like surface antigen
MQPVQRCDYKELFKQLEAASAAGPRSLNGNSFRFKDGDDDTSFTGGAQVGVNGQWGWLVAGLEADFNWLGDRNGIGSRNTGNFHFDGEFYDPINPPVWLRELLDRRENRALTGSIGSYYNGSVRVSDDDDENWLATVRGRLGFTPWERLLVYGTGGVAFQGSGDITTRTTLTRTDCRPTIVRARTSEGGPAGSVAGLGGMGGIPGQGGCVDTVDSYGSITSGGRNQVGWAAGVGIEWAFLDNWSLGVEYLHADFGSYNIAFVDPVLTAAADRRTNRFAANGLLGPGLGRDAGAQPATAPVISKVKVDDSIEMVRVKLNMRFDTASIFGTR